MTQDLYRVLECTPSATGEEIHKNFRRLARRYHPDLHPGDTDIQNRFREITNAYNVLSDEKKRAEYDQLGMMVLRPEYAARQRVRGADIRIPLTLSFIDAINGTSRIVQVPIGEREPRKVEVRIPPGIETDAVLRVEGGGEPGHPPGDLLLDVSVAPHPLFRRDGQDVRVDLPLTLKELVLGTEISLPTPTGRIPFEVPRDTAPDTEFVVRGHGVASRRGRPGGDLRVMARLVLPECLSQRAEAVRLLDALEQLHVEPIRDGMFHTAGGSGSLPRVSGVSSDLPSSPSSSPSGPSSRASTVGGTTLPAGDPFSDESTFTGAAD